MITYRKATIDDLDELVRLRIEFMTEVVKTVDHDKVQTVKSALIDYFNKALVNNDYISWLALDEDKIVGTSGLCFYTVPPSLKYISGNVAYIMNMYTVPAYRSKGIATNIFEKTVSEAKSMGYKKICLNATDMGKPLYKKFGFKEIEGDMAILFE